MVDDDCQAFQSASQHVLLHLHAHSGMHSFRAPWRLAVWYQQTHDQRLLPLLQAQQHFFEGQDLISAGYSLKGRPLEKFTNICFLAPVLCLFKVCLLLVHLEILDCEGVAKSVQVQTIAEDVLKPLIGSNDTESDTSFLCCYSCQHTIS